MADRPWEAALRSHLDGSRGGVRVIVGWTLVSALLVVSLVLARSVVDLGMVQFGLLVGGLLVAAACGWLRYGVVTAVLVGGPSVGVVGYLAGRVVREDVASERPEPTESL